MTRRRTAPLTAALAGGLLALTGCVTLPESGPVVESSSEGRLDERPQVYIDPPPPERDAPAADIVAGFLDAMTATPMQLNDAREFLTRDAVATWVPSRRTITYATTSQPRGSEDVSVRLVAARHLDASGSYRGRVRPEDRTLSFPMTREDGQWRISDAPDALVVPEQWFEGRYRPASLYFFDPSARVLVPEPVFLPQDDQFPTALVRALLRGPVGAQDGISRTFLPSGLRIGSVPISEDGVAEVAFTGYSGQLNPKASQLMLAQLAWGLRQDPAIDSFRVRLGDTPVTLPGGVSEFSVDEGLTYDPTGLQSSSSLFALRDGLLVSGSADEMVPVDGPMGVEDLGVVDVAVNLTATEAVGVAAGRDRALLTAVRGEGEPVQEVVSGASRLLRPAWDFADRLWLVDAAPDGARVSIWDRGVLRDVRVPGVTGEQVRRFLVSRDGSRLVAAVRGRDRDRLVVSRIRHDTAGEVVGATRARSITWGGERELRVRDLAWTSPTAMAVLHRIAGQLYEVRTVPVDGSPAGVEDLLTTLPTRVNGLVGSPVAAEQLLAVTRSGLLDPRGELEQAGLVAGTRSIGYVG